MLMAQYRLNDENSEKSENVPKKEGEKEVNRE